MQRLEVTDVSKAFGKSPIVSDISLNIDQGKFVCFLGPSGCGKTTLLRMIAGLEEPTKGSIRLGGRDITRVPTHERNFGMVFQSLALFPHLTVAENIGYSLRYRSVTQAEKQKRIADLLELVHLPGHGGRRIDQLSGGQRQRIAIARALAQEPHLFLMDEPLSALDAQLREHMQVELKRLQQQLNITTIFVTHDQREAMTVADQIVIMAHGKVQQIASPIEIYRSPVNRFVAGFIGQSNLFEAILLDQNRVTWGEQSLEIQTLSRPIPKGQAVTVCVRPENTILSRRVANDPLPLGKITFVRDLGSSVEVYLDCKDDQIVASMVPTVWGQLAGESELSVSFLPKTACVLKG